MNVVSQVLQSPASAATAGEILPLRTWIVDKKIVKLFQVHANPGVTTEQSLKITVTDSTTNPNNITTKEQLFNCGDSKICDVIPRFLNQYDPVINSEGKTDFELSISILCEEEEWGSPMPLPGDDSKTIQLLWKQNRLIWRLFDKTINTASWIYATPESIETVFALEQLKVDSPGYEAIYWRALHFDVITSDDQLRAVSLKFLSKYNNGQFLENGKKDDVSKSSQWAVTLLSVGASTECCGTPGPGGHAMILFEGVKAGLPFRSYAHLTNLGKTPEVQLISHKQLSDKHPKIFSKESFRPVFIHEHCTQTDFFPVRQKTQTFFRSEGEVDAMQMRINEDIARMKEIAAADKKSIPVKFSLLAPLYNSFNSTVEMQEKRYFFVSTENCLSYAIERLRTSGLRLPEATFPEPDRYIKMINSKYIFTKDAFSKLTIGSESGRNNIMRAIDHERKRTQMQYLINIQGRLGATNLSFTDLIRISLPEEDCNERKTNWMSQRSDFKCSGRDWLPQDDGSLAREFEERPYEKCVTFGKSSASSSPSSSSGSSQLTNSILTSPSFSASTMGIPEDPDLVLLASFLPSILLMENNQDRLNQIRKLCLFRRHEPRKFYNLPKEIGRFVKLESLDLSVNYVSILPAEIGNLVHLKCLNLGCNRLIALTSKISNLVNLERLDLLGNELSILPPGICHLVNLTELNLRSNRLETIPPEIGNLVKLKELDLSRNNLKKLPTAIGNFINLTSLDLSDNNDCQVPSEIRALGARIKGKGGYFNMENTSSTCIIL